MEIGTLHKWSPVHTDYEWFLLHVLLLVLLRVCTEIKYFCTCPYTSVVSCCVVFPAAQAWETMSLKTGPHTREWVFWDEGFLEVLACDTATETLCSKEASISPLHCRNPVRLWLLPASHHGTGISEPRQETSIPSRWRTGQCFQRSHHPWGRSSALLLPPDFGRSRARKWPEDSSTARPLPGLTRVTQGYVSPVSDLPLCSGNRLSFSDLLNVVTSILTQWSGLERTQTAWKNHYTMRTPEVPSVIIILNTPEGALNIKLVKCSSFFFFLLLFFLSIISLHCCISFCCTKSVSAMKVKVLFTQLCPTLLLPHGL